MPIPNYRICHKCGSLMEHCVGEVDFNVKGMKITLDNISHYKCTKCDERVYSNEEAIKIENLIKEGKYKKGE